MRFLYLIVLILLMTSCGGEGGTNATGTLSASFDLEGEEYLADPQSPLQRLMAIGQMRGAYALPDLGFKSNSYPYNQFFGSNDAQAGLQVVITSTSSSFIAQATTGLNGIVQFTELPVGIHNMTITGSEGHNYIVPIQVAENTTSKTQVLVRRNNELSRVEVSAKTIHDSNGDGKNDDDFSLALFNRPRNSAVGGRVHLHFNGVTRVDANGDGDFTDTDDYIVTEPDDDGIKSDEGDGDEDNDGILDNEDPDIDGDDIPNETDPDIDGDGIPNSQDEYPTGITPKDDFNPPTLSTGLGYSGILDIAKINSNTVTVYFPAAIDKSEPITFNIYYSTTSPINFATAAKRKFKPAGGFSPDDILSDNVTGLTSGLTWYFAVRVEDSAQPPVEDKNTAELMISMAED